MLVSMENIQVSSPDTKQEVATPQHNLTVPKMSSKASERRKRRSHHGSLKSLRVGSDPDRASMVKQEVDDFSSDVEGTIPDSETNLVVEQLDTSAIVDPGRNQVIGYENGMQSIAVPETKQNEEDSNFEEEEFDNDNAKINKELVKNSDDMMEFGKSEVTESNTTR